MVAFFMAFTFLVCGVVPSPSHSDIVSHFFVFVKGRTCLSEISFGTSKAPTLSPSDSYYYSIKILQKNNRIITILLTCGRREWDEIVPPPII